MSPATKATTALGKAIQEIRNEKGLAQEATAFKSQIDRSYFSGIERGQHNVGFETLLKLSKGLGVTAAQIVERAERKLR
jgi:transcriptional regulator with XRE-family HTH domain